MLKPETVYTIPYNADRKSFLSCSLHNSNLRTKHLLHRTILLLKKKLFVQALKSAGVVNSQNDLENLKNYEPKLIAQTSLKYSDSLNTQDNLKTPAPLEVGIAVHIEASKPLIMGVDPGISGAISFIDVSSGTNVFVAVFDMPKREIQVKGTTRKRVDLYLLSSLIRPFANRTRVALIEEVNARPDDGRASVFAFGFATGAVCGVIAAFDIPQQSVKPSVWKSAMGLSADKAASIGRALKLFPDSSPYLKRKMDHGRAEAVLLAWFAAKHLRRES